MACEAFAELRITDGTDAIDMLNPTNGFCLEEWLPSIMEPKGGGVWQDPPLAEGRRLVDYQYGNVIETFVLSVRGWSQDAVAMETQKLRRLLEKARAYWITDWQNEPVWIEARSHYETNLRYSLVQDWRTPQDGNPYGSEFIGVAGLSGFPEFTLILERGHWLADEPGTGTCVQVSGEQGNVTTTAAPPDAIPTTYDPGPPVFCSDTESWSGWAVVWHDRLDFGDQAGVDRVAGVRFRDVQIPQGATINGALIRFKAFANMAGAPCNILIEGEDNGTPACFNNDPFAFQARTRTTANVPWNAIPAWVLNNWYNSPSIVTIIQEIVNRGDWASGNDLVIFLANNASAPNARRVAYGIQNHLLTDQAQLQITYTAYLGQQMGRGATCDEEVYIANKHNYTNLTHVYVSVGGDGGVFGPNQVANTAYNLLPAVPAVNDAIYFGIDSTVAWTGPFCSLVFDINAAQGDLTIAWWYSDGVPGWNALTVQDNTEANGIGSGDAFDTSGVNSVHWVQPSDWVNQVINGQNAYWIKAEVTAIGAAPTGPTQQNRAVYSVLWSRLDVDEAQVAGDIPAIGRLKLPAQSNYYGTTDAPDLYSNRVIMSLRSIDRGSNFTPYINFSDRQNVVGIDVDDSDADVAFANDITTSTGRRITFTGGGGTGIVDIGLLPNIAWEWYGIYHVFLRAQQPSGSAGDTDVRLAFWFGKQTSTIFYTDWESFTGTGAWQILDFGRVTLPLRSLIETEYITGELLATGTGAIQMQVQLSGSQNVYLYDLVLMPVDEWVGDFEDVDTDGYGYIGMHGPATTDRQRGYLDVDSIVYPKQYLRALVRQHSNDYVMAIYQRVVNASKFLLKNNGDFRLWFLSMRRDLGTNTWHSEPEVAFSVQLFGNQRYFNLRGAR